MENNDVKKWQNRIEETFKGQNGIVGENIFHLAENEKAMYRELSIKFRGYLCIMDAFLGFIIETFFNVTNRKTNIPSSLTAVITAIYVSTFWRLRSSYKIFWDGYFIDALSLLRAIFENVLDIAALKSEIISQDELWGNLKSTEIINLSQEEIRKKLRENFRKANHKVDSYIIGEKSGLSSTAIDDLKCLKRNLHSAVHKSQANTVRYYGPFARGEKGIPIFPEYDESLATSYMNLSIFIGWLLVKILPLLQIKEDEFSSNWTEKYRILDESFKFATSSFLKSAGRSIEELVDKKFDFS